MDGMCGRTETAKFSSGPLLLEIHPPFVFRFTDARPDSARQSRRATYTSHIVHTLTHRCNAQSSFLPSTEHLRNEPTALKSPAYFKPVFRAFSTDRSGSFWCQRSLMTAFQRLDKFQRPPSLCKAARRPQRYQVASGVRSLPHETWFWADTSTFSWRQWNI